MTALPPAQAGLLYRDAAAVRGRFALSSGVVPADGADESWPRYTDAALVPRRPWRAPSDAEWDVLSCLLEPETTSDPSAAEVAIIRPPQDVIAPLMQAGARAMAQPHQAYQISRQPDVVGAIDSVSAFLVETGADRDTIRPLGFAAKPRGLATATVNTRKRRRAGLHLDRFDARPLPELASARTRFCLNLGSGPRHFLYCAHPVPQMRDVLGTDAPDDVGRIGNVFLGAAPDYAVCRVTIEPGEAYLAATEYLIHDATTLDITESWDLHIAFLCHFRGLLLFNYCL